MKKCVVLLSGGLDSATVLAIAKQQGFVCYALSFNYGQKHVAELKAASKIARANEVEHKIVDLLDLGKLGGSALTSDKVKIPHHAEVDSAEIPNTYVPARNTVFLSIALAWAEVLQAEAIFIGANAVDYSGYPDCRPEYLAAFQKMAALATKEGVEGRPVKLYAPLINLSKKDIIKAGLDLGVDYTVTVSCYNANDDGEACKECDSCVYRKKGFAALGLLDQTRYKQ